MLDEFIRGLMSDLEALPVSRRAAFSAAVARLLEPLYRECTGYEWCRPDFFAHAIARIEAHAAGGPKLTLIDLETLASELLDSSPDMDVCNEYDALDACSALEFALRACYGSVADATAVAEVALDNAGRRFEPGWETSGWNRPEVQEVVESLRKALRGVTNSE